jgi:glucokinase
VVAEARRPTPRGSDEVVETLVEVAEALRPWDVLGVGAAGLVTFGGRVLASPHLAGVRELPLADRLQEQLRTRVEVDNDATCAVMAEWRLGAAQGAQDAVLITQGTGIGAGIVMGGVLQRGAHGFAGEPGHAVVDAHGIPCPCGRRGCWERYASGAALARMAREAAEAGRLSAVTARLGDDVEAVRGEHVRDAAREGDGEALAVIDTFAWWTALGLVNVVNVLDPALVVLGGGLAEMADLLLAPVRRHAVELLYSSDVRSMPAIVGAELGERAGAVGAALLALASAG